MPLDLPPVSGPTSATVRRRRAIRATIAITVVVLVATGGIAYARSGSDPSYRTAVVGTRSVDQTLTGVVTIEPVSQATVAFPSSGTVDAVSVKPGDRVTAGTELASVDPTSLDHAVVQAEASLAQAQLTLERAENSQSSSNSSSDTTAQTPTTTTPQPTAENNEVTAAQQAVVAGQQQVDANLAAADQALASAQQICAPVTQLKPQTSTATSKPDNTAACEKALAALLTTQQQLSTSQDALAQAASHLDGLLTQQANAASQASAASQSTPSSSASSQPSISNSQPSGASQGGGISADDLIADQKAVDAAEAQLAAAQQAQLQASIVSPIDGTVVAVNLAPGDAVTAGSTTATVVITGDGGYEAVTMVKVTDLPKVKLGQFSTVNADGIGTPITGQVSAIGLVSTSGTTGTTYPVTIALTGDTSDLRDGETGTVEITTSSSDQGLAVPTSAVHVDNGRHTVTVLDGNTTNAVDVEVGAIGSTWTAIRSGLSAGQTVVVAALDEPLPSSATSSSNGQQRNPFGGQGRTGGAFVTRVN